MRLMHRSQIKTPMKTIKRILIGALAGSGLLLANVAHAVNDMPGGPVVNGLNFQTPVTKIAEGLYGLHTMMLIICLVILVGVFGVMFYSIFAHRKSKGHQPAHFHESTTVEIIWTVVPFLIVILMAWPATKMVIAMKDTSNADVTVKVTGYQWKWGYDYINGPGAGIGFLSTITTPRDQINGRQPISDTYLQEVDHPLVVPVNKKIRIITTANDVVHSWSVPAFGVKQDAIPGFVRDTWFKAEKVGTYRGFCTELCGKDHAYMPVVVKVLSEQDYAQWVAERVKNTPIGAELEKTWTMSELKVRGEQIYAAHCAVCHHANGKGIGPFPALDGGPVTNGPLGSHLNLVLQGKAQMPPWATTLNDIDLAAVVTYQRNAWSNHTGDLVQPRQVAVARNQALNSAASQAQGAPNEKSGAARKAAAAVDKTPRLSQTLTSDSAA
ncbi:cytochrome C oxidase subunit II [Mycoavidus cysteinexigens]|uniref:Cytochrome c oxidase subunit 2 n=1 Tax=Mycoavidus cysteinexigens TaxID=1553431 RepID=A0A2Z6EXV2_9BURK|nr:cytochrome C oxidase subunit II [Mycoavidus cysteinexigens]GAM53337.1 cytochrome c oxidase polypeptide II [bacterium endosymbiont of Mortierella elongata FMR23-6]GLR00710.1 cytochrome c oxidase subunit 2 [Mycoavidus cysteinexigens]